MAEWETHPISLPGTALILASTETASSPAQSQKANPMVLVSVVSSLLSRAAAYRAAARTRNELSVLSDRELADLGITRSAIDSVARTAVAA